MFTAKLTWIDDPKKDSSYDITWLLGSLYKNGNILSKHWSMANKHNTIAAYVSIPEIDSLHEKNFNKYIKEQSNIYPAYEILGENIDTDLVCDCKNPSAYILYTNYYTSESPIICYDCLDPVPLYKIPYINDEDEHLYILTWRDNYQALDKLQMNGLLEKTCEQQLFDRYSELSTQGIEICRELEKVLNKNVFYYLHKMTGDSYEAEISKKCPECGGDWKLKEPEYIFEFKCEKCRLFSNIACSFELDNISDNETGAEE